MKKMKWLLPLVGSAILIGILVYHLDFARIIDLRQNMDGKILMAGGVLTIPFLLFKALKWHNLLQTCHSTVSYASALRSFLIGMAASLFTPARLGEAARAICFPSRRLSVLGLVMMDKLIDVSVLLGLLVLSLFVFSPWVGLIGLLGGVGMYLVVSAILRTRRQSDGIAGKLLPSWFAEALNTLWQQPSRQIWLNATLAGICFGLMMLQFYLFLSSLQAIPWWVGLMLPIILVVSSVPVSLSGLGLREGVTVLLLSRYGISMETAITAAFSVFVATALLPGLVGLLLSPTLVRFQRQQFPNPS